jgi:hypothetical protein
MDDYIKRGGQDFDAPRNFYTLLLQNENRSQMDQNCKVLI